MSFTESNFVKKLTELNNAQQSIQTLSLWLIHHRKHSKTIVDVWLREINKVKPAKRLTFMYLANDVIQNSKKKGPEFTRDFGTVLADAYPIAMKDADEKMKGSLGRILSIWEERGVYSKDFIKQVRQGASGTPTTGPTTRSSSPRVQAASEPPPRKKKKKEVKETTEQLSLRQEIQAMLTDGGEQVDAESLVRKLAALENSASSDAAVREKIAALPPEVSDISHLSRIQDREEAEKLSKTVDGACMLLAEYNKRLGEELEERKRVAKMLREFILEQKEQLKSAETKLEEYKAKLDKIATVRQELKSHIQNLPDLTLLPDVTGGLAPLPSAGDLFH